MILYAVEMVEMHWHFELIKFLLRNSNEFIVLEKLLKFQLIIFMLIFLLFWVHCFLNEFFDPLIYGGTDHDVLVLNCVAAADADDLIEILLISNLEYLISLFKDQTVQQIKS